VPPVEYAGGKRSLRAYIAVCLQIHCNTSSCIVVLIIVVACCTGRRSPKSVTDKLQRVLNSDVRVKSRTHVSI